MIDNDFVMTKSDAFDVQRNGKPGLASRQGHSPRIGDASGQWTKTHLFVMTTYVSLFGFYLQFIHDESLRTHPFD